MMLNRLHTALRNETWLVALSLVLIALYFLPYVIAGEAAPLTIPDNMDSTIIWVKLGLTHGGILAPPDAIYDQSMGGIPHSSLYWYDIRLLWFDWFGIYWGYVINKVIMALVGFWGMLLLLKYHIFPSDTPAYLAVGTALAFALVPHWSFTLSACGLPLLLYVFLNFRRKKARFSDWLITALFAWYSSIVLAGFFFMLIFVGVVLYDWYRKRGFNWMLVAAMAVLSLNYIISHLPLFYSFLFDKDFVSHRIEFEGWGYELGKAIKVSLTLLFKGHFEARSVSTLIWLPMLIALGLITMYRKKDYRIHILLVFILLTTALYGFLFWEGSRPVTLFLHKYMPIHLYRFFFIHPLAWYLIMGISLITIARHFAKKPAIHFVLALFILAQVAMVVRYHEFYMNRKGPSFKGFYAVSQFDKIKQDIGKPLESYRVMSVGLPPAPSIFNGLYTIDGYFANYPLAHKQKFRKMIWEEIKDDPNLSNHFGNWGSQCYAYSSQIGRKWNYPKLKQQHPQIDHLAFDWDVARKLGAEYVISAFPIDTVQNPRLSLENTYTEPGAYWDLYLYRIP